MNLEDTNADADFREGYDHGYEDGQEDERGIRVSALLMGALIGAATMGLAWWLL